MDYLNSKTTNEEQSLKESEWREPEWKELGKVSVETKGNVYGYVADGGGGLRFG